MNGGRVTSSVRALGGQRFVASFTPHETGIHTVQITFNNEIVPGELSLRLSKHFMNPTVFLGCMGGNVSTINRFLSLFTFLRFCLSVRK